MFLILQTFSNVIIVVNLQKLCDIFIIRLLKDKTNTGMKANVAEESQLGRKESSGFHC